MAKINNKCNSNSFYKNLIYIDILCNNCIFLVFCFYILYIAPYLGYNGLLLRNSPGHYLRSYGTFVHYSDRDVSQTFPE